MPSDLAPYDPPYGDDGWRNQPDLSTEITAAALDTMDRGIKDVTARAGVSLRFDEAQYLEAPEQATARNNIAAVAVVAGVAPDDHGEVDLAGVMVSFSAQTPTSDERAQARANIDAPSTADLQGQIAAGSDVLTLTRIERQTRQKLDTCNRRATTRYADATTVTEVWTDTSAWAGTATVASGRMYNSAVGLAKAISVPAGGRRLYRATLHVPASSAAYAYIGVNAETAGNAPSGATTNSFLVGVQSRQIKAIVGSGLSGATSNGFTGILLSGDYDVTLSIDEQTISVCIAAQTPGQALYTVSIPRSAMPSGAINNLVLSNSETTNAQTWGPLVLVSDLCPPPVAQYTVGGVTLFGAGHPRLFNRIDPNTSARHLIYVPGSYDPRVPAPVVLYLHEALVGAAGRPYQDTKWTNLLSAFDAAGYIVVSTDNGTQVNGAGSGTPTSGQVATWDDQYGNQRGITDYAAAVEWVRQHFNTGPVFLLGMSQGGEFVQNILADRTASAIGGVAAAASISPSTDLIAVEGLVTYQAAIRAVWGATDDTTFAAAIAGFNPILHTGWSLRGVPQRFYVALDDTTTPKATHIDPLVSELAGVAPEAGVVTVATGGHLAAALYQGTDLVTFFSRYAA